MTLGYKPELQFGRPLSTCGEASIRIVMSQLVIIHRKQLEHIKLLKNLLKKFVIACHYLLEMIIYLLLQLNIDFIFNLKNIEVKMIENNLKINLIHEYQDVLSGKKSVPSLEIMSNTAVTFQLLESCLSEAKKNIRDLSKERNFQFFIAAQHSSICNLPTEIALHILQLNDALTLSNPELSPDFSIKELAEKINNAEYSSLYDGILLKAIISDSNPNHHLLTANAAPTDDLVDAASEAIGENCIVS